MTLGFSLLTLRSNQWYQNQPQMRHSNFHPEVREAHEDKGHPDNDRNEVEMVEDAAVQRVRRLNYCRGTEN